MDLLRDIGRELRGRGDADQSNDGDQSQEAPETGRDGRRATRTDDQPTGESGRQPESQQPGRDSNPTGAENDVSGGRVTDGAGRAPRDDEHVCAFCRTSFDANRGDCPECGATLVARGER